MSVNRSPDPDSLTLSGAQRVNRVCDEFEVAWKIGERPRIEEFVRGAMEAERPALLRELLALELELRRGAAENPLPDEYHEKFPEHIGLIDDVFERIQNQKRPIGTDDDLMQTVSTVHEVDTYPSPDLSALAPRYRIHELVGRGAMGWVFRATRQHFNMQVSVKVVAPSYSTKRFRREAECLVKIRSPHVVTVHDFELLPDGTPILVMEWMDGGNLHEAMRANGGRLQEHMALPWMRQTCEGMRAVAEQGIIHRDLKPSNIMIDRQQCVKVADFGLARDSQDSGLSRTGQLMGTAYYMSPEQAEDPHNVDTRSDIYSFGACFYHALTGSPPFDGNSMFSILFKHKTEPLIPPNARNHEISEPTSRLLERCLAKSPEERFQTFRELLNYFESAPWNELEDKALAEYLSKYQSRRADYLSRRLSASESDVYDFPDGRTLRIVVGDVIAQDVDAVVSSDDWLLTMSGGVSKSILEAAGTSIRDELRCIPVRPGRAVVTSGGNLKAKRIFHAVVMGGIHPEHYLPSRDVISEAMKSCFYHADSFFVCSIAFPLLGTGAGRFSQEVCLDTMFRFLARNLLRGVTAVRDARIVLYPRYDARMTQIASVDRPAVEGYQFFDHLQQASEVAGDFLDYIHLPDGRIAMIVADVAGHGLPAAVTARQLAGVAKSYLASHARPDHAVAHFNQHVCQLGIDRFVTMLLAVLDPSLHQVTIVNSGHLRPLLRRADGEVKPLADEQVGIPLGVETGQRYEIFEMTIAPGESITIVTDGITQAMGSDGSLYGRERLRQRVAAAVGAEEIVMSIVADVRQFVDGPLLDALCVLTFRRGSNSQ